MHVTVGIKVAQTEDAVVSSEEDDVFKKLDTHLIPMLLYIRRFYLCISSIE